MDINEALKVAAEFQSYLKNGSDDIIKDYTKTYIQSALLCYRGTEGNKLWYKAMERRIVELDELEKEKKQEVKMLKDKRWWHDLLFINISSGIVGAAIGSIITGGISIYGASRANQREKSN
jgi:hypothetical protein